MSDGNEQSLGQFLRQKREQAGMSIRGLAGVVGVDSGYITRLESGQRNNPSAEVLQGIADALEIDVNDLLAYVGVRPSYPEPVVYFRKVYGMTDEEAREAATLLEQRSRDKQKPES